MPFRLIDSPEGVSGVRASIRNEIHSQPRGRSHKRFEFEARITRQRSLPAQTTCALAVSSEALLAVEAHLGPGQSTEHPSANEFDLCNFDRSQDCLRLTRRDQIASMV